MSSSRCLSRKTTPKALLLVVLLLAGALGRAEEPTLPIVTPSWKPAAPAEMDGGVRIEPSPYMAPFQVENGPPVAPPVGLLDNVSGVFGFDGSKEPQDLGINAHLGFRGAVNGGFPLLQDLGVGLQVGTAINYSDNAVGVLKLADGVSTLLESFTTVGLFQRTDFGLNYGAVYDYRYEHYYKDLNFSQWRGQVGYSFTGNDEVGVWGTLRDHGDSVTVAGQPLSLEAINEANLFWRHLWDNEAVTRAWVGMADEHGRFLLVNPGAPPIQHPFVFGGDLYVPLTDYLAIFAEANFITPNDSGVVVATLGLAFYPGGGATRASRSRFAPLLPLGNNTSFSIDLQQ
jgi:hypothetical protein